LIEYHYETTTYPQWSIELPDGFNAAGRLPYRVLDRGHHHWRGCIFVQRGEGAAALLANLARESPGGELEIIEEQEGAVIRFDAAVGSVTPKHTRLALHAFSTAEKGCAQTSFTWKMRQTYSSAEKLAKRLVHSHRVLTMS
jgi:hypothetical protein